MTIEAHFVGEVRLSAMYALEELPRWLAGPRDVHSYTLGALLQKPIELLSTLVIYIKTMFVDGDSLPIPLRLR